MKTIKNPTLTREQFLLWLEYDSRQLLWRKSPNNAVPAGSVAGRVNRNGYREFQLLGQHCFAHRAVWFLHHGRWPSGILDHINGDPTDNSIANLRECTVSQNTAARFGPSPRNTSGARGVRRNRRNGRWVAQIKVNGTTKYLGEYSDICAAARAYDKAAIANFGEFAWTNNL